MPAPKSPLTLLLEGLQGSASLKNTAKIFLGRNRLAEAGAPGRIVMYPADGVLGPAANLVSTIKDLNPLQVAFRLWGKNIDEAWMLRTLLLQGIEEFAKTGGPYFQSQGESWDAVVDTAQQGEALEVTIGFRFGVDRVPASLGEVLITSLTEQE